MVGEVIVGHVESNVTHHWVHY